MASLRRQVAGGPPGGRAAAATAARQAALEGLTAGAASQLTGYFPLSIAGMWKPGRKHAKAPAARDGAAAAEAPPPEAPRLGPDEALPVLGLHWLDQDVLAAVCQQGLSGVLLVLEGTSLQVGRRRGPREQGTGRARTLAPACLAVCLQKAAGNSSLPRPFFPAGARAAAAARPAAAAGAGPRRRRLRRERRRPRAARVPAV
jgi:hypothetical protein